MTRLRIKLSVLAASVGAVLAAGAASGMTIALIRDEALVDHAPVIVVGEVEARLPQVADAATTRWLFRIEREIKGPGLPSAIAIELPGGRAADGTELHIPGVPQFKRGARLLLFLRPEQEGTHRVFQLPQGAFYRVRNGSRFAALQNLSEVNVASLRRRGPSNVSTVRDFDRFVQWIESRVLGTPAASDYRFKPTRRGLRAMTKEFNLFFVNGRNIRWTVFDTGGAVAWRNNGQMTELAGGGGDEFFRALRMWENERTTPVRFAYAGVSGASGGLRTPDGQNVLLFGDPNGEVEDVICGEGGTLALGGARAVPQTSTFNGRLYWAISEGDMVVNNGLSCLFQMTANPSRFTERLFAHEVGHTLGIFHSSENPSEPNAKLRDALMYFRMTFEDTRGATINADDAAALQSLYKKGKATPPPGPGSCPADTLCLLNGRFRVTATWENQYNGNSGIARVPRPNRALPSSFYNLSGFLYFDDPNNIELIVKVLDFGDVVKVFYGQLTDLRFEISVFDTRTGQTKKYRNTAGECGGFDNGGFPSAAISTIMKTGSPRPRVGRSIRGSCRADLDTMCLLNNRFQIEMTWRNQFDNSSGVGIPTQLSNLTGAFAFTSRANLETLVKVLEFPDRFLVLYGALSNLEYTLNIRDTVSGAVETYHNPAGRYCGGLDADAF
ncbi:MAG: matrixin family metalloprotease [Rhodocyclaceae bacterium]|nr:matrixin family metalloprotease [Rhodocyclaceae bacterium]